MSKPVLEAFSRLFRNYERAERKGTPEEQRAAAQAHLERAEMYLDAVAEFTDADIVLALDNFCRGAAPGHNPSFVPLPPVVAAEVRRVQTLRQEREDRDRRFLRLSSYEPEPPPPPRTPAEQERIDEMIAKALPSSRRLNGTKVREWSAEERAYAKSTNAYFDAELDMSEKGLRKRLGYTKIVEMEENNLAPEP